MAKFDRVPFFFLDSNVESKLEISILKSKIVSIVSNDYTWPVLFIYIWRKRRKICSPVLKFEFAKIKHRIARDIPNKKGGKKVCVRKIIYILHKHVLGLDANHQPFLSFFFFFFFSRRIKTTLYRNLHRLAKKIHPQKQSTYVTNHPSKSSNTSLSLSLATIRVYSRKESGAKRKRDRLKIHGRL